jgi:hypothetical protein
MSVEPHPQTARRLGGPQSRAERFEEEKNRFEPRTVRPLKNAL